MKELDPATIEACAKACEARIKGNDSHNRPYNAEAVACAAAIRALGAAQAVAAKALAIPPERHRTDEQRKDIQRAWDIVGFVEKDHQLNSTEGHLAVLRGIQLGRQLAAPIPDERLVTDDDRQYASELLADLASPDLPRLEIAARWFRKARLENAVAEMRRDAKRLKHDDG